MTRGRVPALHPPFAAPANMDTLAGNGSQAPTQQIRRPTQQRHNTS